MKIGRIATAVYNIVHAERNLTVGEIAERFNEIYEPKARNEIAKRVSDLSTHGILIVSGIRQCSVSGRTVSAWAVNTNVTDEDIEFSEELPALRRATHEPAAAEEIEDEGCGCCCDDEEETEDRSIRMDEEDRRVLQRLANRADILASHPLFKVLAPEVTVDELAALRRALRYF